MWNLIYRRAGVENCSLRRAGFSNGNLAMQRTRALIAEGFEVMGLYRDGDLVLDNLQLVSMLATTPRGSANKLA